MKKVFVLLSLVLTFSISNYSQTPQPTATPNGGEDGDVVKITTNLVQLDAIVTDKKGNPVTNLKPSDFEVYQDGKRQKLANFSFVKTSVSVKQALSQKTFGKTKIHQPIRHRPNTTGRVITFLVDDGNCSSSFIGMNATRIALKKFVTEQMQPNDLVAIYKTRSGSSLMQQYTSDRARLLKVIKKVRWLPSLGCDNNGDFFKAARQNDRIPRKDDDKKDEDGLTEEERDRKQKEGVRDRNIDNQIVGTLGVIRYIVKGLGKIRGRKVLFLFSDGIPTLDEDGNSRLARENLRSLTIEANRASVVVNTIDVRGVNNPGFISAADDIKPDTKFGDASNSTARLSESRRNQARDLQDGMTTLAYDTGGRFYRGNNKLSVHLRRAMNLEKGYYLIGYEPDSETFKGPKFHTIEIKLTRPELKVYSRAGFVGKERNRRRGKIGGDSELYEAINAPLPEAGLDLRLTAFFGNTIAKGNFIRSLIHINGKDIKFVPDTNGSMKAVFDVVAVTLNAKNDVIDEFNRTHTIRVEKRALPLIAQNGLVYSTDVAVKKSGVYNFRVAIRDVNSKFIGSAVQIVKVPKLKKAKIYLSGLTMGTINQEGKFISTSSSSLKKAISLVHSRGIPAIRSFQPGSVLAYGYNVYNARIDKSTNTPKVLISANVYRNGALVSDGDAELVKFGKQTDMSRLKSVGYMKLPKKISAGDYALQIILRDLVSNKTTSQWIDFEITQ